jgi:SnoaL-like protein
MNTIDTLVARCAIDTASNDYALGMDLRDAERFVSSWHDDAVWETNSAVGASGLRGEGHDGILRMVRELWGMQRLVQHVTANHSVVFDGDRRAHGDGHATIYGVTANGGFFMIGAVYPADRFECREGMWRLSYRKVECSFHAEIPRESFADFQLYPGFGGAFGPATRE